MTTTVSDLVTVIQSDIDWLTVSTDDGSGHRALLEWRDVRFFVLEQEGYREKRFAAHGYQYRQRGSLAVGTNGRIGVATASGAEASASWRDLAQFARNVSRVDLAVTGRTDAYASDVARESYRLANQVERGRGRPIQLTLIQGQDRGDTLYVGSRKSDVLGRLYDKQQESRDPVYRGCWRWEVQYRRAPALAALKGLASAKKPSDVCAATVGRWFTDRGISAPFRPSADAMLLRPPKVLPDDQRWLAWVRRCVAPRSREMVERYGWRFIAETLAGPIRTYDQWESLTRGVELELIPDIAEVAS